MLTENKHDSDTEDWHNVTCNESLASAENAKESEDKESYSKYTINYTIPICSCFDLSIRILLTPNTKISQENVSIIDIIQPVTVPYDIMCLCTKIGHPWKIKNSVGIKFITPCWGIVQAILPFK